MAKKENIFPLSSPGGRIQKIRLEKGYSRVALYDYVFPSEQNTGQESKNKTVYNWESGKTYPGYEQLSKICDLLDCDADYLLLRQDVPRREYDHISNLTGLSYEAAEYLAIIAQMPEDGKRCYRAYLDTLSAIIEQMRENERNSLLLQLTNCIYTNYIPDLEEHKQLFAAYRKSDIMDLYGVFNQFINNRRAITEKEDQLYE